MTSNLDTSRRSAADRATTRAYLLEFGAAMLAYGLALTATLVWGGLDGDEPSRFAWALLPVLPMIGVVVAILRHTRRVDEYQRFLLLQGFAVGFGAAMVAAVTVGFLRFAGLDTPFDGWIVFSVGMLAWAISSAVAAAADRR